MLKNIDFFTSSTVPSKLYSLTASLTQSLIHTRSPMLIEYASGYVGPHSLALTPDHFAKFGVSSLLVPFLGFEPEHQRSDRDSYIDISKSRTLSIYGKYKTKFENYGKHFLQKKVSFFHTYERFNSTSP